MKSIREDRVRYLSVKEGLLDVRTVLAAYKSSGEKKNRIFIKYFGEADG